MKKVLSILLAALCAAGAISVCAAANGAVSSYQQQLIAAGFPSAYAAKLALLKEKYPNWEFQPMEVGVELEEAVANERTPHSQQLIQKTSSNNTRNFYCTCSSCYRNGNYVIQEGSSWVSASESAVEYYMDPLNFLDERYIFQFETTAYSSAQTTAGIETIIKNTWMYNSLITYKDSSGTTRTYTSSAYPNGVKYSQAILDAAKGSGTSAYYLASRIVQEVGGKTNSAGGASGTNSTYPGIYNYYNIGANSGYLDGLRWAAASSSGGYTTNTNARLRSQPTTNSTHIITVPEGTSVTIIRTTNTQPDGYQWYNVSVTVNSESYTGYIRSDLIDHGDRYNRPWTNPYVSIVNGAKYIANNFSEDQNTGYLQKFNVNPNSSNMYAHEYMANVQAPSSEASNTYNAYAEANLLSAPKTFIIPVYDNVDPGITGLHVYARGDGGTDLYLEWDPVADANSYSVYIVSGGQSLLKGTTKDTRFVFTDLTPSWEYDVLIIANNSKNTSSGIFTVCAAPAPVEDFDVQLRDLNTFAATWDAQSCHGYYLEWATDKNFSQNKGSVFITGSATDAYTANLPNAGNYYFRIRAWKTFNGSSIYGDFSPISDLSDNLIQPQGFQITQRGNGGASLTLDWTDVAEANGYRIYIVSGDTETLKGTVTGSRFTFTDLTPSWEYDIKVEAFNTGKSSQAIYRICAAPAPVPGFSAEILDENTVELSWDPVTCHGYYIQWATDEDFTQNTGGVSLASSATDHYTMNFENAHDYYVRILAWKNYESETIRGEYGEAINLTVLLPSPSGFQVTAYGDNGTDLTLEWDDVAGADGYRIYIVSGDAKTLKGESTKSVFTFTDLTPGWEYEILVEAYSHSGRSSDSTYTVHAGTATVTDVQLTAQSAGKVTVTWSSVNCHGYRIEWASNSSFTQNTGSADSTTASYTFGAEYIRDYYIRIRAWKNYNGNIVYGDYSDTVKLSDVLYAADGFNVYARGDGGTDLYLEWNDVAGADGYRVYIVSGGKDTLKGTVSENRYTFTDLVAAWEYDVKVVAFNEVSAASATYKVCAAPAPVDHVSAEADGTSITAAWDVQACHGYYIQWASDAAFTQNVGGAFITGSGATSYTLNWNEDESCYIRVRAWKWYQDQRLYGDFSQAAKVGDYLAKPDGFNVYARGDGGTDLYLDWNDVSGAEGYRVYIVSGGTDQFKGTVTESRYTFTDLTAAWEYDVKVVAYGAGKTSESTYRVCAAPAPVNHVSAKSDGKTITATWDVQACHGYYIQWASDADFTQNVNSAFITGSGATSYTIDSSGTETYYIRVRAWKWYQDQRLYGDFSQAVKPAETLSVPDGFHVYARGDNGTDLYLDWNDVPGADGYSVYIVSGETDQLKGIVTESQYTFTDLTAAWEYDVKVVAYGKGKTSEAVYRICAAPSVVQNFSVQSGGNTATATWDVQACHGYYIQWATDENFTQNVNGAFLTGSGATNYTIDLDDHDTYYIRVRAWKWYQDQRLFSDFSAPVQITK